MRHFQDDNFTVYQLTGDLLDELVGFAGGDESRPEKMLVRLRSSGWWEFFVDAFLGHWHGLDDCGVEEVKSDYSEVSLVDYGTRLGVVGSTVRRVSCSRGGRGTAIRLELDSGTLVLAEADSDDPHSDSILRWHPMGTG